MAYRTQGGDLAIADNVNLPPSGTGDTGVKASTQKVTADTSDVQDVSLTTVVGGVRTRNPTLPTSSAAASQVDGHSATIGALGDASSASTLVGLLKAIKAAITGTVVVSGPVTDTQLRATPVPVSGTVTASGPLTDTQLRATAVPVSGTVTATPTGTQAVSAASLPLPTGASTETTLAAANTAIGGTGDAASSTTGSVIAHLRKIRDVLVAGLPALVGGKVPVDASGTTLTVGSHAVTNAGTFATQADTELTTADLDTGAGTDTRAVVGIALAASGGATIISAANPLPVTGASGGGPATIADGADVAQGTTSDVAWVSGAGTVIALLKKIAASGGSAVSVADGADVAQGTTTDLASASTVVGLLKNLKAALAGSLAVTGTFWQATQPVSGTVTTTPPSNASSNVAQVNGVTPLMGAGNTGTGSLRVTIATDQTQLTNALKVDGSAVTQPVSIAVPTSGGYSTSRLLAAASTNATSVKASAGQVYGWYLANAAAYTVFLKLYNKASAPTVGTDTPVMTIPIPAGAAANVEFTGGIAFATGIAFAVTKLVADADTTVVVANDLVVNLLYK